MGKGKGTLKRDVLANSAGFPIEHNFSEYVDRSSIQQIESRKDRRGQSVIEIEYQNSKQKPLIVAYIAGDSLQYVDLKSLEWVSDLQVLLLLSLRMHLKVCLVIRNLKSGGIV